MQITIRGAASFIGTIAAGESEENRLADYHAVACLMEWKAYRGLGDGLFVSYVPQNR